MNLHDKVKLRTGNEMPIIGLGTWKLTHETAEALEKALDMGWPMIDTSSDYGTQPGIAEGIKRSGVPREAYYMVTKVEEDEDSYRATLKNLKELQLDYADLMLIHRPPKQGVGVELWQGLMRAKQSGLTKDIGVSNYSVDQMDALIQATGEVPTVNQIEWSPFGYSDEMFDYCDRQGIVIQAYSPLTRAKRLDDETLRDIAAHYGKTPAQILLRWNLQLGTVPLPKANQEAHMHEDLDVFDFNLSSEDMAELLQLNEYFSALAPRPLYVKP